MPEQFLGPLLGAFILALVFALGKRLNVAGRRHPRRWISLAAGISVAYVFVDLLPELAARQADIARVLGHNVLFAEKRLYLLALIGFVIFYGLEHMILRSRHVEGRESLAGTMDHVFWLHIGGFAFYCWIIGYLMKGLAERGAPSLIMFVFAMALHFRVVDHELRNEHKQAYDRLGRWIMAAGTLLGSIISLAAPLSEINVSRLLALVAGGVVIVSAVSELPKEKEGRFWWFVLGAALYTIVILLI